MGGDENGEMGFQFRGEKVGEETISSMPMFKSSNGGGDTFFGSGWEQLISLNQHGENYGGTSSMMVSHSEFGNTNYPIGMMNQGISSGASHLAHYPPSDSGLGELIPKLSCYGNGNFAEMVGSFGAREDGDYSPDGKRKLVAADSLSPINPNMNLEGEQQMDLSEETDEQMKDQLEKKQKIEKNCGMNWRGKNTGKQTKETSQSGEAPKDYIHVRARRGQATNSHSLAERVRREKISERMKMLQELVPGCNKITGKSVMLDEIINYVQSLQQQVEFLSMKLATVNPELNIDLEQILSKDVLHSRDANAAIFGIGSGINMSHTYPNVGICMQGILSTAPQFHPMPQNVWDNEIQNLLPMGYDTNPGFDSHGVKDAQNQKYRTVEEMKRSVPF